MPYTNMTQFKIQKCPIRNYSNWQGEGVALWWLGQAGFLIRHRSCNIVIDAYLSDVLAAKYRDSPFSHKRMMAAPLSIAELKDISWILSTHSHSDHMDPQLYTHLWQNNPKCRYLVPEAVRDIAELRGAPATEIQGIDAGQVVDLNGNIQVCAIPSAHEDLKTDQAGRQIFLGYILSLGPYRIYHSGDCVPYKDLAETLRLHDIQLALLPVNGRRAELSKNGIPGNFSLEEASTLLEDCQIPYMVAHHYGMFSFNTIPKETLQRQIQKSEMRNRIFPAEAEQVFSLQKI